MFVAALNIFKEIARLSTANLAGRMATIDAIVSPRNKYFQLITECSSRSGSNCFS